VFSGSGQDRFLATTDVLNESIHFDLKSTTPYLLGRKSLAVNLSDIAAMGGRPLYYLIGLSLPNYLSPAFVRALYRGMQAQATCFDAALLGGDTVAASGGLSISVTLLGRAHPHRVLYRSGARPGDLVFVSGTVGDSALGLALLQKGTRISSRQHLVRRHLDPEPRVGLGCALADAKLVTSMIDVSDGVAADLGHILDASRVGAEVYLEQLPLSRAYQQQCPGLCVDVYAPALSGGEDYELLFTAAPKKRSAVEACARKIGVALSCIGRITGSNERLKIIDGEGQEYKLDEKGFRHF